MAEFKVGDWVSFDSEAGQVTAKIIKKHTQDVDEKAHTRCCSPEDPQFEIKSEDLNMSR